MTSLDMDSPAVERDEGPSVRDAVIASVAAHRESPDVTNAVNAGISERDREIRSRSRNSDQDHFQREAATRDHRHGSIRNALNEANLRAAQGNSNPVKGTEVSVSPGPPTSWSTKDKQVWDTIPESARLAILSDHSQIRPHLERYVELNRALAPAREIYQQHGLSDGQALSNYAQWVQAFHNPQTRVPALLDLARQYGVDLQAMGTAGYSEPNYTPQEAQAVEQHLAHFAQSHPHYEQARVGMGLLFQMRQDEYISRDGNIDLERAYHDVCRYLGVGTENRARRAANLSPRGRAPAVHAGQQHRGGGSVRNSLLDAINQHRA
jgi:hypothetical protein